jgi:glycosyltransferase involved in cell wall biosynthesis
MKVLYIHPGQTGSAPDAFIKDRFPDASFQMAGGFSFSPGSVIKLRKTIAKDTDTVVVRVSSPLNYFKKLILYLFLIGTPGKQKYAYPEGENRLIPVKLSDIFYLAFMFLPVMFLSAAIPAVSLVYTVFTGIIIKAVRHPVPKTPEDKKLVFLCPSLQLLETFRGSTSHVKGTLSGFEKSGWKAAIISPGKMDGVKGEYHTIPPVFRNLLTGGVVDMLFDMIFTIKALGIIRNIKPAFIYQRHGRYCISGVVISKLLKIPLVLEMNALLGWESGRWSKTGGVMRFFINHYEKICLANAFRFSAISEKLREDIIAAGVDPSRVFTNPNGADADNFKPGNGGNQVRRDLGLENRVVAGFSGSFYPWHGVDFLADAILKTTPANPDLAFLLIGEGPELAPLVKKLADAGISIKPVKNAPKDLLPKQDDNKFRLISSVFITGKIPPEEVPSCLDACDILLSPIGKGKEYSSPIKIFEYMAAGKAILCFEAGQMKDIFENGADALMTPTDESEPFAAGLEKLAKDKPLRQTLGTNARHKMEKNYTWQANALRILGSVRGRTQCH